MLIFENTRSQGCFAAIVWLLLRVVSPDDYVYDPDGSDDYDYCDIHTSIEDFKCSLSNLPSPETLRGDVKQCCESGGWLFEDDFGCPERQVKIRWGGVKYL